MGFDSLSRYQVLETSPLDETSTILLRHVMDGTTLFDFWSEPQPGKFVGEGRLLMSESEITILPVFSLLMCHIFVRLEYQDYGRTRESRDVAEVAT